MTPEKKKVIRQINAKVNQIGRLTAEVERLQVKRDGLDMQERLRN
jgi:hypothetical protein